MLNITGTTTNFNTNSHLMNPPSTGSPNFDMHRHYSGLSNLHRRDFEELRLTGTRLSRVAPDDVPAGNASSHDADNKTRIASIPYAVKKLGNETDAAEFIRCVRLIAGDGADALTLQSTASYYYEKLETIQTRFVLKEMALLAMQLEAVTSSVPERYLNAEDEEEFRIVEKYLTPEESCALAHRRAAQLLDSEDGVDEEYADLFADELQYQTRRLPNVTKLHADEFKAYFIELRDTATTMEEYEDLISSEVQFEDYTQNGLTSLHLGDGERLIAAGDLLDDVSADDLPEYARHLADQLEDLYTSGAQVRADFNTWMRGSKHSQKPGERIIGCRMATNFDEWIEYAVDELFIEDRPRIVTRRTAFTFTSTAKYKTSRLPLIESTIARANGKLTVKDNVAFISRTFSKEQTYGVEVLPHAEERAQIRFILETLLEQMKADIHTRALHTSGVYRWLFTALSSTDDTADIARLKREAWLKKEAGKLSLTVFTLFNTFAEARAARLTSDPLRETIETEDGHIRMFIVAQPFLNEIGNLCGKNLGDFNQRLTKLPRQERERVRRAIAERNSNFYARVRDGLAAEIRKSSVKRLGYFRFALYGDNRPDHPVHILTQEDQARAWSLLKERTGNHSQSKTTQIVH